MKGSTSSAVFLVQDSSSLKRFVLRVPTQREWLAEEPDLAAHEAAALDEACKAGLPAPELVAYASDDVGFGVPVVLMSWLEGAIDLCPADVQDWLANLAAQLAAIHQHRAQNLRWRYRSWVDRAALAIPNWTTIPAVWQRAIERVQEAPPDYRPVLIHRDYHPANILWRNGSISGVVDWVSACRGPAGVDVAHCRTNLALMFGPALAEQFLDLYSAIAGGFEYNPYWDIDSILDVCLPEPSFYPPWQEFGLSIIPPHVLRQRIDDHLAGVVRRL